jgi:hypothetical protein
MPIMIELRLATRTERTGALFALATSTGRVEEHAVTPIYARGARGGQVTAGLTGHGARRIGARAARRFS